MTVAFLLRPWPVYGGGETVTICLANEFVKRGINTFVFYTKSSPKDKPVPFIDERIKSERIDGIVSDEDSFSFSKQEILLSRKFLQEQVEKNKINIIINQWWPVECLVDVNVKVIKCLHTCLFMPSNYDSFSWFGIQGLKKLLGRRLYFYIHKLSRCRQVEEYLKYVDKYLFLAPCDLGQYLEFRRKSPFLEKLDYCYNPLPSVSDTEIDYSKKRNQVLFVGRMYESYKRVSRILKIWHIIENDTRFRDWTLEMVGDGPDKKLYIQMASDLKLKRITFHGFQDPKPFYEKAKIFLMTSNVEGWGMTLVESQEHGVVPIVFDTFKAVHDIITNEENGIIVSQLSLESYVEKLENMMLDDLRLQRMAENGIETSKRFSVSKVVDKWQSIFKELVPEL